jgi:hypothetical protein
MQFNAMPCHANYLTLFINPPAAGSGMSALVWVKLSNDNAKAGAAGGTADDSYVWRSGSVSGDELIHLTTLSDGSSDRQIAAKLDSFNALNDEDDTDGEEEYVSESDTAALGELINVNASNVLLRNVWSYPPADLVQLVHLHEPAIVQSLYERYRRPDWNEGAHGGAQQQLQRQIYTWCGPILLAINPFQRLPNLYDDSTLNSFATQGTPGQQEERALNDGEPVAPRPHVFAVAAAAFNQLTGGGHLGAGGPSSHSGESTFFL